MKNKFRFSLARIICILWLICLFPVNAAALGDKTSATEIEVGNAETVAGGTVSVDIFVRSNPGFVFLCIGLDYDANVFTIEKVDNGEVIGNLTEGRQYVWYSNRNIEKTGRLLTVTFKVLQTAEMKKYDIGATIYECSGYDEHDVPFSSTPGVITVLCPHKNTVTIRETPATCKESGFTAGIYCNDCKTYISGHDVIPATGNHIYGEWVKKDDKTHERICSVCGEREVKAHEWAGNKCSLCGATRESPVTTGSAKSEATVTEGTETTTVPNENPPKHAKAGGCGSSGVYMPWLILPAIRLALRRKRKPRI